MPWYKDDDFIRNDSRNLRLLFSKCGAAQFHFDRKYET